MWSRMNFCHGNAGEKTRFQSSGLTQMFSELPRCSKCSRGQLTLWQRQHRRRKSQHLRVYHRMRTSYASSPSRFSVRQRHCKSIRSLSRFRYPNVPHSGNSCSISQLTDDLRHVTIGRCFSRVSLPLGSLVRCRSSKRSWSAGSRDERSFATTFAAKITSGKRSSIGQTSGTALQCRVWSRAIFRRTMWHFDRLGGTRCLEQEGCSAVGQ